MRHRYSAADVKVSLEDFELSIKQFVPSVSAKDMIYFKQMINENKTKMHDNKKYVGEGNLDHRATS